MLVSILIPCYNAGPWLEQAIESALAQTWPHKEIVVVDDGSTDGSLDVIRSFGDRIRWETGPNRGGNSARNRLLDLARGDWLQYLDADDYLLPHKVAAQINYGLPLGNIDVLYAPVTAECWRSGYMVGRKAPVNPPSRDPWTLLVRWLLPQTSNGLFRREAIQDVGGWKPDQPCCQEHELYLRLLQAGKRFEFCPHGGAIYRLWSNETVCNRNPLLTLTTRLTLIEAAEESLSAKGGLTSARSDAIAQARLECARSVYALDRDLARRIASDVSKHHPRFYPPPSACFPARYRLAYRLLGFSMAERLAEMFRRRQPANDSY
jgi:glycosyltransferase involved in cell wall biosynthesis